MGLAVGVFKKGQIFNGQGTHTDSNGSKFVGKYRDGKKHGQGTLTFAYGEKYVGEYKDGKRNGQGIKYHADGTVEKEGIWGNDKFKYAQKVTPLRTPEQ